MTCQRLYIRDEAGNYTAATPKAIVVAAREAVSKIFAKGSPCTNPDRVGEFLIAKLSGKESESFACLFLDGRHSMIAYEELFHGTIDAAAVYPRQVVKRALHHNAAALILAHNHPSGMTDPSRADEQITLRLKESLSLIDVRVLDHFIVGDGYSSFAQLGLI